MICSKVNAQEGILQQNLIKIKELIHQYKEEAYDLFERHVVACNHGDENAKVNLENKIRFYIGNFNMILEKLELLCSSAEENGIDSELLNYEIDGLFLDCISILAICTIIIG